MTDLFHSASQSCVTLKSRLRWALFPLLYLSFFFIHIEKQNRHTEEDRLMLRCKEFTVRLKSQQQLFCTCVCVTCCFHTHSYREGHVCGCENDGGVGDKHNCVGSLVGKNSTCDSLSLSFYFTDEPRFLDIQAKNQQGVSQTQSKKFNK